MCEELYSKLGFGRCWEFTREVPPQNEGDPAGEETHFQDCNGEEVLEHEKEPQEHEQKIALFSSTLGSRALQHFTTAINKYEAATHPADDQGNEAPFSKREIYEAAMNDLACLYFQHPGEAVKVKKRYLREGGLTFCGEYSSPREFCERLCCINQLIPFFPFVQRAGGQPSRPSAIDDDDLIEMLDKARTTDMQKLMLALGDHARKYATAETYAKKLEEWHENVQLTKALERADKARAENKRKNQNNNGDDNGSSRKKQRRNNGNESKSKTSSPKCTKPCVHCGRNHSQPDDQCWTLDKNKDKRPKNFNSKPKSEKTEKFDKAVSRQVAKATKEIKAHMLKKHARKRRVIEESESSEEEYPVSEYFMARLKKLSTSDNESDNETVSSCSTGESLDNSCESHLYQETDAPLSCERSHLCCAFKPKKKVKKNQYTAEIMVEMVDRHGNKVPARGLLDTGTTHSLLLREFVERGRAKG